MALPKQPGIDRFLKWVGASVVIHIALAAFLNFNPWPTIIKVRPTAYTVTLMPLSLREPETSKTSLPRGEGKETTKGKGVPQAPSRSP